MKNQGADETAAPLDLKNFSASESPAMTTPRTTKQWQQADSSHFLHPFTDHQSLAAKGARVVERAEGVYIWDTDGNKILDGMSGLWCVNVG